MLVFGTRPEAIKMAPLYHALKSAPDAFETSVCITAQHRQMLDQVMDVFNIEPDIDLNLMKSNQDLSDITASVLLGMRSVLLTHRPDALLVHGDTSTSMAAAMAGFYTGTLVGHVEAGLRTHDLHAPFPEEFNRQITSKIARWHFAPTSLSASNLMREQIPETHITVTGNTVIDALHWILRRFEKQPERQEPLKEMLDLMLAFNWLDRPYVLVTGHRRENFGEGFQEICRGLKDLAHRYPNVHFVYPVHLNPNVQKPVREILSGLNNVHLLEPLSYEPFVLLLKHAHLVLTDSGGIQEEAPSLGKPVLVMREVTERPEAVSAGTVRLVGASRERITAAVSDLLDSPESYQRMARAHNPYGDGQACTRILDVLRNM